MLKLNIYSLQITIGNNRLVKQWKSNDGESNCVNSSES
jgi:hypothetical protein